jgi:hypothetical protein
LIDSLNLDKDKFIKFQSKKIPHKLSLPIAVGYYVLSMIIHSAAIKEDE